MTDIRATIEGDGDAAVADAFLQLATAYFAATRDVAGRVSTPRTFAELATRFDEPMPVQGRSVGEVVARLRDEVLPDCNRLYHPRYVGHQVSAPLPVAAWTESLTGILNQSVAVFEMSPVATALEHRVVRWLADLAGYDGASSGTFTTGGTEATFTALLSARAAALPDAWMDGVGEARATLVCGEHAHYAVTRAAGELGIGMRNVALVPSRDGRMDPAALAGILDDARREGRRVIAVVATAGSTATGAFDDLDAVADVCDAHGAWLHVDGAHGASALLSAAHRHRLRGIARARSLAWDPHKMMLMPLQAGVVLFRDAADLDAAFAQRAPYLFHGAAGERAPDQGVRSFLCSRRADVLKVWVALQRYGAAGIGALHDHLCDVASAFHAEVVARPAFEAIHAPESNILCFRYVGTGAVGDAEADELNRALREAYNRSGEGWVTTTVYEGRRVLRVTVMNPRTTADDARAVLDGLERIGAALETR